MNAINWALINDKRRKQAEILAMHNHVRPAIYRRDYINRLTERKGSQVADSGDWMIWLEVHNAPSNVRDAVTDFTATLASLLRIKGDEMQRTAELIARLRALDAEIARCLM